MGVVLIVDDEAAICWALRSVVEREGHDALVAATGERALELFRTRAPDAVFLDVRLPGASGLDILDEMTALRAETPIVVITAHGGLDTAVRAMQSGALDYLAKPLDLSQVRAILARALAGDLRREGAPVAPEEEAPAPAPLLTGTSPPMQDVYKRIGSVAATDVPVLIQGESGSGKELVARAIHASSRRRDGPFEAIDCAALPGDLIASELYGHERGAFTGAVQAREGRIRRAHGGTVFLDEIGELGAPAQSKLLRFLSEKEVTPIGGASPLAVDVRVIAATNRPLEEAVQGGLFRGDLFYRLNVFGIRVPPLRERKADISALVERFIANGLGKGPPAPAREGTVSGAVLELLARHDWPGNVRELRNAVEHALVIARGSRVLPEHLPGYLQVKVPAGTRDDLPALALRLLDEAAASGVPAHRHATDRVERALLEVALARAGGSISQAARILGLTRVTVRKRARELGIEAGPPD